MLASSALLASFASAFSVSPNAQNRRFSASFLARNEAGRVILSKKCQGRTKKQKFCTKTIRLVGLIAASLPLALHFVHPLPELDVGGYETVD
jgi:hypothetical protein